MLTVSATRTELLSEATPPSASANVLRRFQYGDLLTTLEWTFRNLVVIPDIRRRVGTGVRNVTVCTEVYKYYSTLLYNYSAVGNVFLLGTAKVHLSRNDWFVAEMFYHCFSSHTYVDCVIWFVVEMDCSPKTASRWDRPLRRQRHLSNMF